MSKLVFLNGGIKINGQDLSDHVHQVALTLKREMVDVTSMGANARQRLPGLQDNQLVVQFWQDEAASSVGPTLWTVFTAGTAVAFAAKTDTTVTGGTVYSGSIIMTEYPALDGNVGDGLSVQATFMVSGTVAQGTTF
jgi:hypothetical protein